MPTYVFSKKQFVKWLQDGLDDKDVILFSDAMAGNLQVKKLCKSVTFEYAKDVFAKPDGVGDIAFGEVRPFSFMRTQRNSVSQKALEIIAEQDKKTNRLKK